MRLKKSQSLIDFILVFIATVGLAVGIVRIWAWFNVNYASRQQAYQKSRLIAAGRNRPYDANQDTSPWPQKDKPVEIGAKKGCPECEHQPLDLTEEWVFRGTPSGTVSHAGGGGGWGGLPGDLRECQQECQEKCKGERGCVSGENFNTNCACYRNCYIPCACRVQIGASVENYREQARFYCGDDLTANGRYNCQPCSQAQCLNLNTVPKPNFTTGACSGEACLLRRNAAEFEKIAEECDDPWEICWWGTWGKTARELREAASKLRKSAYIMEATGRRLQDRADQIQSCCGKKSAQAQQDCFDEMKRKADCDRLCSRLWQSVLDRYYNRFNEGPAIRKAEEAYAACFEKCTLMDVDVCEAAVGNMLVALQNEIQTTADLKKEMEKFVASAQKHIADCNLQAQNACDPWKYGSWNEECYQRVRNECCRAFKWPAQSRTPWERNCDTPTANCDTKVNTSKVKCGLAVVIANYRENIQKAEEKIARLKATIPKLKKCCQEDCTKLPKEEQGGCLEKQEKCITEAGDVF